MTLRRYAPMKQSRGTVISSKLRSEVLARDGGCVGPRVGMPGECFGGLEIDHIRAASFSAKSATEAGNLITLCAKMHREKTLNGRQWRPKLLEWVAQRDEDGGR